MPDPLARDLGKVAIVCGVRREPDVPSTRPLQDRDVGVRLVASGPGWLVQDIVCGAGPRSRPFEEQHTQPSLSLVLSGLFTYRSSRGDALLAPGAFLLGQPAALFTCSHEHGVGDRCLSIQYESELFESLVAALPFRVSAARLQPGLPAVRRLTPLAAAMQTLPSGGANRLGALALEELVVRAPALTLATLCEARLAPASPRPSDARRVADIARTIESRLAEDLSLSRLAGEVGLSPYHFLRVFKQVLGVTPHQWLMARRLAAAARSLTETDSPVTEVALDAGFADLSNFNAAFRRTFGVTPTEHRRRKDASRLSV